MALPLFKSAVRRSGSSTDVRRQLAIDTAYPSTSATVAVSPSALVSQLLSISVTHLKLRKPRRGYVDTLAGEEGEEIDALRQAR